MPLGLGSQAELGDLLVSLVNLGEQGARSHRHNRVLWNAPAELFDDLEAHALGAFGVVGTHVHIHEGPAVFPGDLRAETVHFIVMPLDADDVGAVDEGVDDFTLFQIRRDKHVGLEAGGGGVGGHRIGQVSGRSAGHGGEPQFARPAQGHADHPVLERERRVVNRVVLDPQFPNAKGLGQAVGFQ